MQAAINMKIYSGSSMLELFDCMNGVHVNLKPKGDNWNKEEF